MLKRLQITQSVINNWIMALATGRHSFVQQFSRNLRAELFFLSIALESRKHLEWSNWQQLS